MSLSARLSEYVRACFTGVWIESFEHDDALVEIAQLCRDEVWRLLCWDIESGLRALGTSPQSLESTTGSDPLAAIHALDAVGPSDPPTILVLSNFHRFLGSPEIIQAVARRLAHGKQSRTFLVVLSPVVQIPVELERQFVVQTHDLPNRQQLAEIAIGIATEPGELPEGQDRERILDAAGGLTRFEAEGAFSLAITRHHRVTPDTVWELKAQSMKKSGLLTLHRGGDTFASIGGLQALKDFCLRVLRRRSEPDENVRAKGVMLLGVPGTGKSAIAKALGNETGRPTIVLDIGSLYGGLVGQTESNVRQALRAIDAMAPCVLYLDELDKALAGVASSGQTDSGVSARLFGSFLTWLNDRESDVFVVATCNDVSKLPPEFLRAERWDANFFIDLPGVQQRRAIWTIYERQFQIEPSQTKPVDSDWTGSEILACCRLAKLLDVPLVESAKNIVPIARMASESVSRLRQWADGRCLSADVPGVYKHSAERNSGSRRRVKRDPSNN